MKKYKYIFTFCCCIFNFYVFSQEMPIKDTIIKGNGEVIICNIKSIENDKIKYLVGNKFLTTTYTQRVSEIKFSDGTSQFITPVLKIGESDWEKVIVTSDLNRVKNLVEKGYVEAKNQGSIFSKQEKLKNKSIELIKKEAAKLGAHIVLITNTNDVNGSLEFENDQIIGVRSGSTINGTAYGY